MISSEITNASTIVWWGITINQYRFCILNIVFPGVHIVIILRAFESTKIDLILRAVTEAVSGYSSGKRTSLNSHPHIKQNILSRRSLLV